VPGTNCSIRATARSSPSKLQRRVCLAPWQTTHTLPESDFQRFTDHDSIAKRRPTQIGAWRWWGLYWSTAPRSANATGTGKSAGLRVSALKGKDCRRGTICSAPTESPPMKLRLNQGAHPADAFGPIHADGVVKRDVGQASNQPIRSREVAVSAPERPSRRVFVVERVRVTPHSAVLPGGGYLHGVRGFPEAVASDFRGRAWHRPSPSGR
jgi:hypothetical protein